MSQPLDSSQLITHWANIEASYPTSTHELVEQCVTTHKEGLATAFYKHMMEDKAASYFLSGELVQKRLHASLQAWMVDVFSAWREEKQEEIIARQRTIGEVHARIGIPAYLVMRGARCLDREIYKLLASTSPDDRTCAACYVAEITSLAIEIMCHSYAVSHERNMRAAESYRLFAAAQDIGAERERQRSNLLNWENELMFALTTSDTATPMQLLSKTEFGLWFLHKGSHVFEGANDVQTIGTFIAEIDQLTTQMRSILDQTLRISLLVNIREKTKALSYLLDQLFQAANHMESGRDALTRQLNRRYLQVIIAREIEFARHNSTPLSVLQIDADDFKSINDTHGHEAGDIILQQISLCMSQVVRSSDYIFRLGGEEFLILLVDADLPHATTVAERLRSMVANESTTLPSGKTQRVTLSIGVAEHNGHPDYTRLLRAADAALYQAKKHGKNAVHVVQTSESAETV